MLGRIDFLDIDFPKRWSKKGEVENLSFKKAKKFIKYLRNKHNGYVSFDTETESLAKKYNRLVSIQFSIDDETGFVICLDKPYTDYSLSEANEIKNDLKELFEDENTGITWIGHNAQFDVCQVCNQLHVKNIARPVIDNILFIHLLDENRIKSKIYYDRDGHPQKMSQALKSVCKEFFGFTLYDKEAIEARGNNNLLLLPKPKFIEYAGMDGYVTFRVFKYLHKVAIKYEYWEKAEKLLIHLLSPALKMLSWVSSNGFCVDVEHLKHLLSKDSPINSRLEEIKEEYMQDPTCKAVNDELYKENSNGMTSTFGMTTPWVLNLNKEKHRVQLFYLSKKGFQLEPVSEPKAKSEYGTGKTFQNTYAKENKIVALYQEEQGLKKLKTSYLNPIWETMTSSVDAQDGRIRADFVLNGTVTGRVCVRKGTYIEAVRDVSKFPKGIKIENLKKGDYVYCYNNRLVPTLRKVLNVWKSGTNKELVRVHWQGACHKTKGYVDVTPNHKIRLSNGDYVRADELSVGDSVLAMSRKNDRLWFTGYSRDFFIEHRFIYSNLFGKINEDEVIHHIDRNHLNNNLDNLEKMTRDEHIVEHAGRYNFTKSEIKKFIIRTKNLWKNPLFREKMSKVNSREASADYLIELMDRAGGKPTVACKLDGWDYETLMKKFIKANLNWRNIAFFYGYHGNKITKESVLESLKLKNTEYAAKNLGVGTRKLKELCSYFGIKYGNSKKSYQEPSYIIKEKRNIWLKNNNHRITKIEFLKERDDVYDVEVEGCHNFIGNGICLHNCSRSPNLQQIPRSDTLLKKQIKCLYCAEPPKEGEEKKILVQADFCANEIRFWAAISSDPYLCKAFNESFAKGCQFRENPEDEKLEEEAHLQGDIHKQTASMMYKVPLKEVTKDLRQSAKSLSLGIMYQRGVKSVAKQLKISEEEAQKLFDKFFEHFTVGVQWANKQKEIVKKRGYVESPLGRRRRLGTLVIEGNKYLEKSKMEGRGKGKGDWIQANKLIGRAERQAVNSPIQGLASDLALISLSLLHQYIIKNNLRTLIVNSVHDSVVMEIPESEVYKMAKVVRRIFTEESRKYAYDYFQWRMPTHIDVDFEVGQNRNYICKKCGAYVPRYKDKCDCGCTELKKHKLNMGYGTLLGWNETKQELKLLAKGF